MKNRLKKLLPRWFHQSAAAPFWIDATVLATCLAQDSAPLIVDVRGHDEFVGPLGHIAGARNLPLNELPGSLPNIARDNRPIVVVCKTDRRSSIAARQLLEAGVSNVSVLRGGMEQWRGLGLSVS
jgi:rhodanese-related sulfurtransferase